MAAFCSNSEIVEFSLVKPERKQMSNYSSLVARVYPPFQAFVSCKVKEKLHREAV